MFADMRYIATTKFNLIIKLLIYYIQYIYVIIVNLINHAMNYDDLIFKHWMNVLIY